MKNLLNLIKKQRRKLEDLINKKPLKFNKKIRKKASHLLFYKRLKTFEI